MINSGWKKIVNLTFLTGIVLWPMILLIEHSNIRTGWMDRWMDGKKLRKVLWSPAYLHHTDIHRLNQKNT